MRLSAKCRACSASIAPIAALAAAGSVVDGGGVEELGAKGGEPKEAVGRRRCCCVWVEINSREHVAQEEIRHGNLTAV